MPGHRDEESCDEDYRVVPTPEKSRLERFASWFHQDWKLVFSDFDEGARIYVRQLSDTERAALRQDLRDFLKANEAGDEDRLRRAWLGLGAHAAPRDRPLRDVLRGFLQII